MLLSKVEKLETRRIAAKNRAELQEAVWKKRGATIRGDHSLIPEEPYQKTRPEHIHVYVIYNSYIRTMKIGITISPKDRIKSLEGSSGVPLELLTLFTFAYENREKAHRLERQLHAAFASDRMIGEWFKYSDDARKIILSPKKFLRDKLYTFNHSVNIEAFPA
jgi:hypothetical protein